jgi:hypothetical protein
LLLQVMDAVLLHVLNHCAKTADVIKKNNDKIKGADAGTLGGLDVASQPLGVGPLCGNT